MKIRFEKSFREQWYQPNSEFLVLAPGSSSSCWVCENPLLSYLHPFFWPLDHLITEKFCWNEASDTIIQTCLHSNGLTRAGTAVKVVPNLEQDKSKSHSAWKHNSPSSSHSNRSKNCLGKTFAASRALWKGRGQRTSVNAAQELSLPTLVLLSLWGFATRKVRTFSDPEHKLAARAAF